MNFVIIYFTAYGNVNILVLLSALFEFPKDEMLFSQEVQKRDLEDQHLVRLSKALPKYYRKLMAQLGLSNIEIETCLTNHEKSIEEAVHSMLTEWLLRQRNRIEAYVTIGMALCHNNVRLNLIAGEVLDYPPVTTDV